MKTLMDVQISSVEWLWLVMCWTRVLPNINKDYVKWRAIIFVTPSFKSIDGSQFSKVYKSWRSSVHRDGVIVSASSQQWTWQQWTISWSVTTLIVSPIIVTGATIDSRGSVTVTNSLLMLRSRSCLFGWRRKNSRTAMYREVIEKDTERIKKFRTPPFALCTALEGSIGCPHSQICNEWKQYVGYWRGRYSPQGPYHRRASISSGEALIAGGRRPA